MKIWHDDVRPAPVGWVWAKDNETALQLLRRGGITTISLDHDLGADPSEGLLARGGSAQGTGYDLVEQMIEEELVPDEVIIHSWNTPGAWRMQLALEAAGYGIASLEPYQIRR